MLNGSDSGTIPLVVGIPDLANRMTALQALSPLLTYVAPYSTKVLVSGTSVSFILDEPSVTTKLE